MKLETISQVTKSIFRKEIEHIFQIKVSYPTPVRRNVENARIINHLTSNTE